eukprot:SAG31_NODE_2965_length_4843_cov_7.944140_1_plen_79_part_10
MDQATGGVFVRFMHHGSLLNFKCALDALLLDHLLIGARGALPLGGGGGGGSPRGPVPLPWAPGAGPPGPCRGSGGGGGG